MSRVYFIRAGRFIKIGVAINVGERLRYLQISNPEKLVLIGHIAGNEHLEKAIHKKFERLRERSEWFRVGKSLLSFIEETLAEDGERG